MVGCVSVVCGVPYVVRSMFDVGGVLFVVYFASRATSCPLIAVCCVLCIAYVLLFVWCFLHTACCVLCCCVLLIVWGVLCGVWCSVVVVGCVRFVV